MKYILLFILSGTFSVSSIAQNCSFKLSGHIEDADTKEKLTGATVVLLETAKTIVTDDKGDFTFENLCAGTYTLEVSHIDCGLVHYKVVLTKSTHVDVDLPHDHNTNLNEVTVTTTKKTTNTGMLQELKGRELEETKGLSIAEAFSKINGVSLLQTGPTVAKPVIHGLHSNRILTINNGVRQEGQQWGSEHAPEIDPFIADNLSVIKGADELKYGSDAIGGVILINPKPLKYTAGNNLEINTGYFTNNMEYVISAMFEQQLKKLPAFSYRIQGTFKQGANTTTPDYRLNNTALKEKNFSVTAGWKKEKYNIEAFFSQFNTTIGIFTGSHIGNLSDLIDAINAAKPDDIYTGENTYAIERPYQEVTHRLFKLKTDFEKGKSKFNIQFAAQYNRRKEYDVTRSRTDIKPQMDLYLLTLSEDIGWQHPAFKNIHGSIGVSSTQQENIYGGRYFIPNYNAFTAGAYWIEKWAKHKWEIQGGMRYDHKSIDTKRILSTGATINHSFDFSTFASSLNVNFKANRNLKLNTGLSLSGRAPYVNELLSNGIHHSAAVYEEGDINLQPEKSLNIFAGLSYTTHDKKLNADITIYNNYIRDFIYEQPIPDEPVLTIAGAFPKLQYQQTNALLRGIDVDMNYFPVKQLLISSKVSILRAYNRSINDWLIGMPADMITNELTWNFKDAEKISGAYISIEVPYTFEQTRVPDETVHGKQDYKAPPDGYALLNLNTSAIIRMGKLPVTIGVSAKNILNQRYREYLNSFRYFTDAPGINFNIRAKILLENLL